MGEASAACFHCGEPCVDNPPIEVLREGETLPFCCHGCEAVSELIFASGLDRYYQFRSAEARRAGDDLDALVEAWSQCDERRSLWGTDAGEGLYDLLLQTEGVHCAACAWLIRSRLEPREGIQRVQVDMASGYTRIIWDPRLLRLSDIAVELARIGYRPHLPLAEDEERGRLSERRDSMIRVGVAGLGMMQVMMYAVGLYAGEALGISDGARRFLSWTSLLVTLPVVWVAGRPFFEGAWRNLAMRRVGMDVPVALAVGVAFLASTVNFFRGQGEVYFDSVVMFLFFLSSARHIQLVQRHRSLQTGAALARLLPEWARRLDADGEVTVLTGDLVRGDLVRVSAGEPFPADGRLAKGRTRVDESLLTGESRPLLRDRGDKVVGGSINLDQPVDLRVTASGADSTVSALGRMLLRARSRDSQLATQAERLAGWFVLAVLLVAMIAGAVWWWLDTSRALSTMLAVLVVSCPCALSLATPAALAAAARRLLQDGILMTRGDALEALSRVDTVVFDKTGTLTQGRPVIHEVYLNPEREDWTQEQATEGAAALAAWSAHPMARAFPGGHSDVEDAEEVAHAGVRGRIGGQLLRLGKAGFAGPDGETLDRSTAWLSDTQGWIARFSLDDGLRGDARTTLDWLAGQGLGRQIASGDHAGAVLPVAGALEVSEWAAGQSPADKMARVHSLQNSGRRVLMVGDGVNDAPVLASADVSMTVAGASEMANSAADLILTTESLHGVRRAIEMARSTHRIIRQNLTWALGYNLLALPLAVTGLLQPWMAALGMSLSSLLVVGNAARLGRRGDAG